MSFCVPKECIKHPGYYHIPDNEVLVVSPDIKFINLLTDKPISIGRVGGFSKISCRVYGKTLNWYVHRLVARTFVNKPRKYADKDYDELEVSHKNGDKTDNNVDNLEWLTPAENANHHLDNFSDNYHKVLAKNVISGSIKEFPTTVACSKAFEISNKRLRRHLKSKYTGTRTRHWYVFKYDDGSDWPELKEEDKQINTWDMAFGIWYAKSEKTSKVYFNKSLQDLCEALGLEYSQAQAGFKNCRDDRRYAGYVFWYDDRPVSDVLDDLPSNKPKPQGIREPMKIKVVQSGIETIYDSSIKAGKALDVSPTTVTYAIKNKAGKLKDSIVSYV